MGRPVKHAHCATNLEDYSGFAEQAGHVVYKADNSDRYGKVELFVTKRQAFSYGLSV